MPSNADGLEGWLSLWLVALSGFVLALLSAFLPRRVGTALVVLSLFGAVAAACLVARRRGSIFRALLPGLGPAAGAGIAGTLSASAPVQEVYYHLGSGLGVGLIAILVGFVAGVADARVRRGAPAPERRDVVGFLALLVAGTMLVAVTAPYATVHL